MFAAFASMTQEEVEALPDDFQVGLDVFQMHESLSRIH